MGAGDGRGDVCGLPVSLAECAGLAHDKLAGGADVEDACVARVADGADGAGPPGEAVKEDARVGPGDRVGVGWVLEGRRGVVGKAGQAPVAGSQACGGRRLGQGPREVRACAQGEEEREERKHPPGERGERRARRPGVQSAPYSGYPKRS